MALRSEHRAAYRANMTPPLPLSNKVTTLLESVLPHYMHRSDSFVLKPIWGYSVLIIQAKIDELSSETFYQCPSKIGQPARSKIRKRWFCARALASRWRMKPTYNAESATDLVLLAMPKQVSGARCSCHSSRKVVRSRAGDFRHSLLGLRLHKCRVLCTVSRKHCPVSVQVLSCCLLWA